MTGSVGYVAAMDRARRLAVAGSLADAVLLAALRAGCAGRFAFRAPDEPLMASREFLAVLAVMESLPSVTVAQVGVAAHG